MLLVVVASPCPVTSAPACEVYFAPNSLMTFDLIDLKKLDIHASRVAKFNSEKPTKIQPKKSKPNLGGKFARESRHQRLVDNIA